MQDQNNNIKNILSGPVFDFIIKESVESKPVWNYNGGMIDGRTEGNLQNSNKGVNYMSQILQEVKPKRLLETGTNYGSFSYIVYENLDEFELLTCDIVADSQKCVDFINTNYNKQNVKFTNKSSLDYLQELVDNNEKFDLVWLDSKHTYDHLIEEMKLVKQMDIPYILIDDFSWVRGIQLAIFDFLKENEDYKFYSYSNNNTQIGSIVVIKKIINGF